MGIHEVNSVILLSFCRTHSWQLDMTIQTQLHPDALIPALYSILNAYFAAGHGLLKSLCSFVCMSSALTLYNLDHYWLALWQSEHLD